MTIFLYWLKTISSCLLMNYIIFDFLKKFFGQTYKKRIVYAISYICVTIMFVVVNIINLPLLNFTYTIIEMVCLSIFLYNGETKAKIIYLLVFAILISMCEVIALLIASMLFEPEESEAFFGSAASQILTVATYYLFILFVRKRGQGEISTFQFLSLFILPILSIGIIFVLWEVKDKFQTSGITLATIVFSAGLVIVNVYVLYLFDFILTAQKLRNDLSLYTQQSDYLYRHYKQLDQKQIEFSKLQHDMYNHLNAIDQLYKDQETAKGLDYSKKLHDMLSNSGHSAYTSNRVLNVVIHNKVKEAKDYEIDITCEIEDGLLDFMDDIDITTIIANLMDNAIETCKNQPEKAVVLRIYSFNGFADIFISNPSDEGLRDFNGSLPSRKGNRRGIGIPNIIRTVEKYGGSTYFDYIDGQFSVNIVIPRASNNDFILNDKQSVINK